MIRFLRILSFHFIALSMLFSCGDKSQSNIIIINDLGWKDVGFMGSNYYETPNLDNLGGQGMVFYHAYAAAANFAPSRACIMSGMNTPKHERRRQAATVYPNRLESVEVKIVNAQREEAVQKKLANSLKDLPIRQSEVIQYLFFESLSYEQTAKLMGINLRSVYTLAWKALPTLKKSILSITISLILLLTS